MCPLVICFLYMFYSNFTFSNIYIFQYLNECFENIDLRENFVFPRFPPLSLWYAVEVF